MKKQASTQQKERAGLNVRLVHWLKKYDFRDQERFIDFLQHMIFGVLIIVVGFMLLQHIGEFNRLGGWTTFMPLVVIAAVVIGTEAWKLSRIKRQSPFLWIYAIQALAVSAMSFITSSTSATVVYMIVLTELYISFEGKRPLTRMFLLGVIIYIAATILQNYMLFQPMSLLPIITQLVSVTFALTLHFICTQIALSFYRQFLRLNTALRELNESKRELEKAYAVVAEMTALEERQRIAKDIHDTAGHSLTTVIMQTESAKLLINENPEAAKNKIIAANLQAKHALEELRNSVHVLSGRQENQTLKNALQKIIQESTDGTGITIRSKIENVQADDEKFRFLCNSLKEGISNGLRHGKATAFWFSLLEADGEIRFLLSDNGNGAKGKALQLGYGLSTMQERARALGGKMLIEAQDGEGVELQLILPKTTKLTKNKNNHKGEK